MQTLPVLFVTSPFAIPFVDTQEDAKPIHKETFVIAQILSDGLVSTAIPQFVQMLANTEDVALDQISVIVKEPDTLEPLVQLMKTNAKELKDHATYYPFVITLLVTILVDLVHVDILETDMEPTDVLISMNVPKESVTLL